MTDYPDMARSGDWSGVRDSSEAAIWRIFRRFVTPLVVGRGYAVREFTRNPRNPQRAAHHAAPRFSKGQVVKIQSGIYSGRCGVVRRVHRYAAPRGRVSTAYDVRVPRAWPSIQIVAESDLAAPRTVVREAAAANPPTKTLIYPDGRLVGHWHGRHRNGGLYRHRFSHAHSAIYGLPDGSIVIKPRSGRLWRMFER